jgi:dolichol-phosphate mannosyltransferase
VPGDEESFANRSEQLPSPAMERSPAAAATTPGRSRAERALRARHNWVQLAKFCTVGASGYAVNLAVYTLLLHAGLHYLAAAVGSFTVAVTNNYLWNRLWTFRGERGHFAYQGLRFLVVSVFALGANLIVLRVLVALGLGKIVAQAVAIIVVTPLNFVGNKLWSFRRS